MLRRRWKGIALAFVAVGLAIQLTPYGRQRPNPPVAKEPEWNDARTRALFFRACRDCHSNETRWPWYATVAPASWLVRWDVEEGRSHLNVSEWGPDQKHADDAAGMVRDGEMPLWRYLLLHPEARLSERERAELAAGLEATFPEPGDTAAAPSEKKGPHHDGGNHAH